MKEYSIEKDAGQGNTVTPPGLLQTSRRAGDTESYLLWHRSPVPGSELVIGLKSRRGKIPLTTLLESSLSQLPGSAQSKTGRKHLPKAGACFNTRVSEFQTKHQSFEAEVLLRPGSYNRVSERLMKRI